MKVYLDSVGCRLNQAEIERMARQFRAAGHEMVASPQGADLAVVNTCAVTSDAAADSRQMLRQIARAGVKQIIPTGCLATLQPEEVGNLPNILRVVSNDRKERLVEDTLELSNPALIRTRTSCAPTAARSAPPHACIHQGAGWV